MNFMSRLLRRLLVMLVAPAIFIAIGWYGGARYGAPAPLVAAIDSTLASIRAGLAPLLGEAAERGSDYVAGTVEQMFRAEPAEPAPADETPDAPSQPSPQPEERLAPPAIAGPQISGDAIRLCTMQVSNQPRPGAPGSAIGRADETARINGVRLLLMPATGACLSSGYGYRNGRLHRGVDYYAEAGGDVLAAGDGTVVEAVARADYGNMVVIDHGAGVYTRYAHLARLGANAREGAAVKMGAALGPIGRTGATSITHLHYEVLTGDYNTRAGSFGLEAADPFGL